MLASEAMLHFRLLELEFGDRGFQCHDLIKHGFGFDGDVHRAGTGLVGVELAFGFFQLLAYIG
ncbi:hypothetical protein D3C71_2174170 [compost metagenome]